MTTTELRQVPVPGGTLAYSDRGAGPCVVLLHGGALDHRMWAPQIGPIAAAHRVVAVDLRGHGSSSTPTEPFRHSDDLAALIAALGAGPVTLVGVSLGAGVAVETAAFHPDLVDSLVVSGAGSPVPEFRDPWLLGLLGQWAEAEARLDRERWLEVFLQIGAGPHRALADTDPDVVRRLRDMAADTLRRHVPDGPPVRPVSPDGVQERIRTLDLPVLAVPGLLDSDDHIRMAREIAESSPRGRIHAVRDAAHYPNLERPETFNEIVLDFLGTVRGRGDDARA